METNDLNKAIDMAEKAGMDLLQKSRVKAYTRTTASGAAVQVKEHDDKRRAAPPQADSNRDKWDSLHDEEHPGYTFQTFDSKALGKLADGSLDAKQHAKEELANRGQDSDTKWVGFDAADKHHGISAERRKQLNAADVDAEDNPAGHFQTVHGDILSAAAKGHLDLQRIAKKELADRGQDNNGKWIGFDAAKKHHGVK